MTTLTDRPGTALLVIDVQNAVVAEAVRRDEVVATIASLVLRARDTGVPVVWVQHSHDGMPVDSAGWRLVDELVPDDAEPVVHKTYPDAFDDTGLADVLAERDAGHLVVTGAATEQCIQATLYGAQFRGYDTTLVADAHTTSDLTALGSPPPEDVIAQLNLVWGYMTAPGRRAGAVEAAALELTGPAAAPLR